MLELFLLIYYLKFTTLKEDQLKYRIMSYYGYLILVIIDNYLRIHHGYFKIISQPLLRILFYFLEIIYD